MRALKSLAVAFSLFLPSTVLTSAQPAESWLENRCLASALHYEARGEPLAGRRAVLDTILHRMYGTGKGACAVVLERGQFSWSKKKPLLEYNEQHQAMLLEVVQHPRVLKSEGYKYFYSGPQPDFARGMICKRIFAHNFCMEKKY